MSLVRLLLGHRLLDAFEVLLVFLEWYRQNGVISADCRAEKGLLKVGMQALAMLHHFILALVQDCRAYIFLHELVYEKGLILLLLHLTPLQVQLLQLLPSLIHFRPELLVFNESDLTGANPRHLMPPFLVSL